MPTHTLIIIVYLVIMVYMMSISKHNDVILNFSCLQGKVGSRGIRKR